MSGKLVLAITLTVLIGMLVSASASAEISVGVKKGDWIEYTVATTGVPTSPYPTPYPTWAKVEVQSVEGSIVTVKSMTNMSDGTENTQTTAVNIATGSGGLFVIPAEMKEGDTLYVEYMGNITISGVETRTYANTSRIVLYANMSQYDITSTVYWDQATGILVEMSQPQGDYTMNVKAVATNMWQTQLIDPTVFLMILIVIMVVIGIVATVAFFAIERKNKRPEEVNSLHSL